MYLLLGWLALIGPGSLEGQFSPAVHDTKITKAEVVGERTVFSATTIRIRPGCDFREVDWNLGGRKNSSVPVAVTLEKAQVRKSGLIVLSNWSLDITPVDLMLYGSYADVLHSCRIFWHWDEEGNAVGGIRMPWLTRTAFWN